MTARYTSASERMMAKLKKDNPNSFKAVKLKKPATKKPAVKKTPKKPVSTTGHKNKSKKRNSY